jgi:hypothetical protein
MDDKALEGPHAMAAGTPEPVSEDEEVLDWDASIKRAPPRPGGTIQVQLAFGGRSKPPTRFA